MTFAVFTRGTFVRLAQVFIPCKGDGRAHGIDEQHLRLNGRKLQHQLVEQYSLRTLQQSGSTSDTIIAHAADPCIAFGKVCDAAK